MGQLKYAYTDSESESATAEVKVPPHDDSKPAHIPKYVARSSTRKPPARKRSVGIKLMPKSKAGNKPDTPPSEWNVDQVVEWLKSNRFGRDVYDKFIEHDITGDTLFDLDVNNLKAEIGIEAFGKRTRLANAIAKLCYPQLPQRAESIMRSVSLSLDNPNAEISKISVTSEPVSNDSTIANGSGVVNAKSQVRVLGVRQVSELADDGFV